MRHLRKSLGTTLVSIAVVAAACSPGEPTEEAQDGQAEAESEETETSEGEEQAAQREAEDNAVEEFEQQLQDEVEVEEPEPEPGTEQSPLSLGESSEVGDWTVAVTDVDWDAEEDILSTNSFNEPAPEGHTYGLVHLEAIYNGEDAVSPWLELNVAIIGSDARTYQDFDNTSTTVVDDSFNDEPEVRNGGQVSGYLAIEVADDGRESALVEVSESLSFSDDGATYWVAE